MCLICLVSFGEIYCSVLLMINVFWWGNPWLDCELVRYKMLKEASIHNLFHAAKLKSTEQGAYTLNLATYCLPLYILQEPPICCSWDHINRVPSIGWNDEKSLIHMKNKALHSFEVYELALLCVQLPKHKHPGTSVQICSFY